MKSVDRPELIKAIAEFHAKNASAENCTAEACVAALGKRGYQGDVRVIHGYDDGAPADLPEDKAILVVAGEPVVDYRFSLGEYGEDEQVWDSKSSLGEPGAALVSFR